MPIFKNHEIRVRLADTKKENKDPNVPKDDLINRETLKNIEETTKRIVKAVVVTVGVAVLAIKTVDIVGEVVVKKTRSGDYPEN